MFYHNLFYMKLLALSFIIFSFGLFGQGNLQFNKALHETYFFETFDGDSNSEILNAFTVPAGKVWKLTSIQSGRKATTLPFAYQNGGTFSYRKSGAQNYVFIKIGSNPDVNSDIVWIPEGTYDLVCRGSDVNTMDYLLYFTGIEFNLLP